MEMENYYSFAVFTVLLLILDLPVIKYVILPNYKKINVAMNPIYIYIPLAYLAMAMSWFLIEGNVYKGALTGFVIYATYAFTLACILNGYTFSFAMTEIIWGTVLFTLATFLTKLI
jgi:uncharacterized membrane protein